MARSPDENNPSAQELQTTTSSVHFPCVDVEAWLGLPEDEWLPMVYAQLAALYNAVDEAIAASTEALDLPCHRGCDACCRNSVFLTPLEFAYAWEWAQEHLDDHARSQVVAKGLALYQQHQDTIEAFEHPPPEGERDHYSVAKHLHFPCPLLDSHGACQIYPARELFARLFGVSFNADGGMYGCQLVQTHMEGKQATLLTAQTTAQKLRQLPMTHKRQVYPYYINQLYGSLADTDF